jgi:hypothetical protein
VAISLGLNNRSLRAACALAGPRVCCAVEAAMLGTTWTGLCSLRMRSARTQAKAAQNWSPKNPFFSAKIPSLVSIDSSKRRPPSTHASSKRSMRLQKSSHHSSATEAESRRTDHVRSPVVASASHQGYTDRSSHYSASPHRFSRPLSHKVSSASQASRNTPRRDEHSERSATKRCSARAAATTPSANLV